jgi:hypothetical protein
LPLAPGAHNELAPRVVRLSPEARKVWTAFADHVEKRIGPEGELASVRGLANKLPEHAARLAAVLALVNDIDTPEIAASELKRGIELAEHYAAEALRLFGAGQISADLQLAQRVLAWLKSQSKVFSLPCLYQRGPSSVRDKATAEKIVDILYAHGYLERRPDGAEIDGKYRKEAWRLVSGV